MGRGRAKAKQTKVARALKYGGPQTDLERLQKELQGGAGEPFTPVEEVVFEDDLDDDPYAKYVEDDEDDLDDVQPRGA
jgi:hypothetical protein